MTEKIEQLHLEDLNVGQRFKSANCVSELARMKEFAAEFDPQPFVTDGGNYILDRAFGPIESAEALQSELDSVVGLVEHGLFIGLTSPVLVGTSRGVKRLERKPS